MELEYRDLSLVFRNIIAGIPEAIMLVDADSKIIFANGQAETLFGYKDGKLAGNDLGPLIPSQLAERHRRHVAGFINNRETSRKMGENLRVAGVKLSGEEFPAEASITHIQLKDGQKFGMVIIRDISGLVLEKPYVGSYLQATSDNFDRLGALDALDNPIVVLDTSGNYLYINPAGLKRLKRTKEELLGQNIWVLFPYLEGTKFQAKFHEAIKSQQKQTLEEFYPSLDIWYQTEIFPSETALVLHITNVTKLKKVQSQNKRLTDTLEQALDAGANRKDYRHQPPT